MIPFVVRDALLSMWVKLLTSQFRLLAFASNYQMMQEIMTAFAVLQTIMRVLVQAFDCS